MTTELAALSPATAAETLAAWQAIDAERRRTMTTPGVARPDQLAGRSGLETFAEMLAGRLPSAPIGRTLEFVLAHVAHGRADYLGKPLFEHYNPLGTVHGGWIATLLDSAVGCAVHTTLAADRAYTTLELKVNYVKALGHKVPMVLATGRTIAVGRRIATAEGRLVGADGTLYAHASTTCMIFDPPTSK